MLAQCCGRASALPAALMPRTLMDSTRKQGPRWRWRRRRRRLFCGGIGGCRGAAGAAEPELIPGLAGWEGLGGGGGNAVEID